MVLGDVALTWALFVLALAGWLAVTAVIWAVLYAETKRHVGLRAVRRDRSHHDDGDESGDSPV